MKTTKIKENTLNIVLFKDGEMKGGYVELPKDDSEEEIARFIKEKKGLLDAMNLDLSRGITGYDKSE